MATALLLILAACHLRWHTDVVPRTSGVAHLEDPSEDGIPDDPRDCTRRSIGDARRLHDHRGASAYGSATAVASHWRHHLRTAGVYDTHDATRHEMVQTISGHSSGCQTRSTSDQQICG